MGKVIPSIKAPKVEEPKPVEKTEPEDGQEERSRRAQRSIAGQTVKTSLRGVLTNTSAALPERKKLLGE